MSHRHQSNSATNYKNFPSTKDADRPQQSDRSFQYTRRDDDTNYDHVTMDMSEESNNNNSDVESPRRESRRRSSQSSGDRDYVRPDEFSPDDDTPKSREHSFVSSSNMNKDERKYSRDSEKKSSSDRSLDDDNRHMNDDNGKCSSFKEREFSRRYDDRTNRKDRENPERRDRDSDRRDREGDRDRRYDDRDRDRHGSHYREKYDKKYHMEKGSKSSFNDDRRRDRSRSRDRNSGSHKRRSPSGERDRNRSNYRRSEGSQRSDSREGKSYKRSRSRERSPASNTDYKPSYKVSKKLQALDKMGLQIKAPDGSMATPQMLLKQTLAEQVEKVKNETGIELPKYYNPAVMNPFKYANQMQKRKLLWGNKSKEIPEATTSECNQQKSSAANIWQGTKFAQDTDGKVASKFLRLMGIKDGTTTVPSAPTVEPPTGDIVKKQEEMFEVMQAQYDVARATTHTMRGVGLGFSSHKRF